jgi:hypothetical protein
MISQYWKDQIPARPLSILVKNQDGTDANLSGYTTINIKMVGSRNEEVSLAGAVIETAGRDLGRIILRWPTDRSLFEYIGDYVLQLELLGTGKKDFTSTHTLRVRELGRVNR